MIQNRFQNPADEPGCWLGMRVPPSPLLPVNRAVTYRLAIVLIVASLVPGRAFAWGSKGHRIIAEIAEQYLEPETARQVHALIDIENAATLPDVANWADQIRPQHRETASWHFVDIPISASGYDATRDCAGVAAKIDQFTAELRNRTAPPRQRLEALKFVIHFVGELHRPLHGSDNDDRGGNGARRVASNFLRLAAQNIDGPRCDDSDCHQRKGAFEHHKHFSPRGQRHSVGRAKSSSGRISEKQVIDERWMPVGGHVVIGSGFLGKEPIRSRACVIQAGFGTLAVDLPI